MIKYTSVSSLLSTIQDVRRNQDWAYGGNLFMQEDDHLDDHAFYFGCACTSGLIEVEGCYIAVETNCGRVGEAGITIRSTLPEKIRMAVCGELADAVLLTMGWKCHPTQRRLLMMSKGHLAELLEQGERKRKSREQGGL